MSGDSHKLDVESNKIEPFRKAFWEAAKKLRAAQDAGKHDLIDEVKLKQVSDEYVTALVDLEKAGGRNPLDQNFNLELDDVPSVDEEVDVFDDLYERMRQRYLDELHWYGITPENKPPNALQWILGRKTFSWLFFMPPHVEEKFFSGDPDNYECKHLGYRFHLFPSAYGRLTPQKKQELFDLFPECIVGPLTPTDTAPDKLARIEEERLERFNKQLASDEYKVSFADFLFEERIVGNNIDFIEYPSECRERTFNFYENIKSGLLQRKRPGYKLPDYATQWSTDSFNEDGIIDFLKARANAVREHINAKIKETEDNEAHIRHIFEFARWAYHPVFDNQDNFFVKLPLYQRQVFIGWLVIFFNGNTVKTSTHLREAGKRLQRTIRENCGWQVYRYINAPFPAPHESLAPTESDTQNNTANGFLNKCNRYFFYNLFRIAMTMGCARYSYQSDEHVFAPYVSSDSAVINQRNHKTAFNGCNDATFIFRFAEQSNKYIVDRVEKHCRDMLYMAETIAKMTAGTDKNDDTLLPATESSVGKFGESKISPKSPIGNKKKRSPKANTIQDKLNALLYRMPEYRSKTANFLASELGCSASSIKATETWKQIMCYRPASEIIFTDKLDRQLEYREDTGEVDDRLDNMDKTGQS